MRPLLSSAATVALQAAHASTVSASRTASRSLQPNTFASSVCLRCQLRSISHRTKGDLRWQRPSQIAGSPSVFLCRLQSTDSKPVLPNETTKSTSTEAEDHITRVKEEDLPSHREEQRWALSKRLSVLMDHLQEKLADASQKVNRYTGTDYTGIAALRQEIKDQENLVKTRRSAVEEAKTAVDAAHAQQAASQKEVVGLLERKHSWSAADLERYMSLIRSEHLNDQAVTAAKDNLRSAERSLEETRARLERRERAQYHEEQIWSDTIRRNSTWVTFGLMGFNILLLLASVVIIEPWRRKRLVKEVRAALDEQATMPQLPPEVMKQPTEDDPTASTPNVLDTQNQRLEQNAVIDEIVATAGTPSSQDDSSNPAGATTAMSSTQDVVSGSTVQSNAGTWMVDTTKSAEGLLRGLFSEQQVSIRKVDLTSVALESAAAGAVLAAMIMALLRPR